MGALLVLLWKHFIVRKRRFIHTPVEFLSPIIYFLIVFLNKDNLVGNFDKYNEVKNTEPFDIDSVHGPYRVLYTPSTKLTDELMDDVGSRLKIRRLDHLPRAREKGYVPFSDFTELKDYTENMQQKDAIVVFQDMNGTWPNKLRYTIRMNTFFNTHSYEPIDGHLGPHENFGKMYEPFARLQWTIDTSYLHLLTGVDTNQVLTLQEFPYSKAKENSSVEFLCAMFDILCPLSLTLVFVFLMCKLLDEKNTGIQELVKMVGVSPNTLCLSHFINALPAGLIYAIVCSVLLTTTGKPFLPHTNGFIIFLVLLFHFATVIAMAFVFAYVINTTQHITTISVFVYLFMWLPSRWLTDALRTRLQSAPLVLLSGFLPHVPLQWLWLEVGAREKYGVGVTFANMAGTASLKNGSVLLALLFMVLQTALFLLLAWYLSLVRPGKYGQALPWSFPFSRQYWSRTPKVETLTAEESQLNNPDPQYFEPAPKGLTAGIQISHVTKAFPRQVALSDVTLDVYRGEITVLLGHNGAGKTTLMSIITGLMSPTSGRVLVNGMDSRSQQKEVRSQLGLCPQHNLFFSDLTVLEHLMFFALLKGGTFSEARVSSRKLLEKLNILDKADCRTDQLSGGMKRRVQLACALSGGASVLILDEPTSGLDVETRRELWDLLLSLRGDRTVLLTTHFMEEADALGDRVAALHAGQLRCHATTMFLKRAVGTGYRLSFTTIGPPNEPAITSAIHATIPGAALRDQALNAISYSLPAKDCSLFPALFTHLEEKRSELGIDSIGVGKSTLEEVFLRLCSDVHTTFANEQGDTAGPEMTFQKLTGPKLYLRQFAVLMMRQFRYLTSKKYSFILLQIVLPVIFIFLVTKLCNDDQSTRGTANARTSMDLDMYRNMPHKGVMYNFADENALPVMKTRYKKVEFEKVDDVATAVLEAGNRDILEYNKYLVGIEINDTDLKALFTTTVRHALPVSINLLTNILASELVSGADGATVTTYNHPLEGSTEPSLVGTITVPKSNTMMLMWTLYISFVILAVLVSNTTLPCRERVSGTRHIHLMCSCPLPLYWAATLAAHLCVALVFLLLPTVLAPLLFEADHTTDQGGFLWAMTVTLTLGVLSFSAPACLLTTGLAERGVGAALIVATVVFSFVTPALHLSMTSFGDTHTLTYKLLQLAELVMPPHAVTLALSKGGAVARLNAYCRLNRDRCPALPAFDTGFDAGKCCESTSDPVSYFSMDENAPGKELIIMAVQFVVYLALLLLADQGFFERVWDQLMSARLPRPKARFNDSMVRAENAYVEKAIQLPKKQISEAMLCYDIQKNYPSIFKKSCFAVKGISFSVKKGECFGLLGVNGAGKSTTFKMLTGEVRPTRGTMYSSQHYFEEKAQYMRTLSYCPQFFGLDDFLTGRQNLELVLTLRGLDASDVRREAMSWIEEVGLEQYADRRVSSYSGGCARRLATAAALCQQASAALLDEPTAGVDPAARRRVHCAVLRAKTTRSLVIASHSMDEMEALCDRIAILSGGALCALGSAGSLRAQHAAGHAVVFKLRAGDVTDGGDGADGASAMEQFKGELHRVFDCALKDEHQTMLHYHINDTMRYSELFSTIETLKQSYPQLVEDYTVTETTLEEVFLSFAKEAQENSGEV